MITEILAMLSHIDSAEVLKRAKEALKKNRNQLYVLPEIESKEEPMGIRAEDVNLSHLGTLRVGYAPKNILTEAIQATQENIGKLALEFESELRYNEAGFPFFLIDAERGTEDKPKPNSVIGVYTFSWIVVLRNEIHVFHAKQFEETFELEPFESEELRGTPEGTSGNIFDPAKPGSWLSSE
jgi:hypothetical protein